VKVAIIAPLVSAIREPQRGGSQAFVSDLARGLAGRGHEVHVYAAAGSQIAGVTVIDTGIDPSSLQATLYRAAGPAARDAAAAAAAAAAAPAFAAVYSAVRQGQYDLVHNHAFDAPAISLATALKAPVVHTLHLPPETAVAAALREAAAGDDPPAVAVVSASQAVAWRRVASVDAILPPYVPTRLIPWSASPGAGAIVAGRLSPEKGTAEAIDIALTAGSRIDVYGDAYDPDYARERIYSRRHQPGVTVHPGVPRSSMWAAMARAAVVVCPARWDEPFGIAAADAQACGTPVVAFRRGGLAEIIVDGVTGFLVPPDDIQAAAASLAKVTQISRAACRDHAERHLDLERSLDAHGQLYRRVTSPMTTSPPARRREGPGAAGPVQPPGAPPPPSRRRGPVLGRPRGRTPRLPGPRR
jgi:glycosyltransferase involved in cell wall biosynthesis